MAAVTESPARHRDGFLDTLRAIAIIRVVMWHAFGEPVISWVIATMPLMFFVAGSLLFRSLESRPTGQVLRSRLKRLLVPFWFFGAVVLAFLSLVHLRSPGFGTRLSPDQLLAWIIPLVNPTASAWEAGWASSPLWYIRAYLWLLLLSPLLVRAWRRLGITLLPIAVAVMMIGEIVSSRQSAGPDSLIWIVGDLGVYACFVLLGFAHATGMFDRLGRRDLVEWLLVGAIATVVAWRYFPSDDGVVNHSYPALLTSGIAWLAAVLLARPWLSRVPQIPVLGAVLYWMTRRAMSIYLWHSPAIVGAHLIARTMNVDPGPTVVLGLAIPLVTIASVLTGWIEDVAGGRPATLWPTRSRPEASLDDAFGHLVPRPYRTSTLAVVSGGVAAMVAVATIVPAAAGTAGAAQTSSATDGLALPPAPSGRPDPTAGAPAAATSPAATSTGSLTETSEALQQLVEGWLAGTGIDGVRLAVSLPGEPTLVAGAGIDAAGAAMTSDVSVPITSVTKTMTAAIVLQLVDEGLLDLDASLRTIPGAGDLPGGDAITIRQLLDHSSGLAPYQEAPGYDAGAVLDPGAAVRLSLTTDLQWEPGTRAGYSNSGFLALGLIIEATTGMSFEEALTRRIIEPLGLKGTALDATPTGGWVGGAAGGVTSTVADLANWGAQLYRDGGVISPTSLVEMITVEEQLFAGLGAFPVCPCEPVGDGTLRFTSVGHNGGTVSMQYSPHDDAVIVVGFSESFWTGHIDQADVYALLAEVRTAVTS